MTIEQRVSSCNFVANSGNLSLERMKLAGLNIFLVLCTLFGRFVSDHQDADTNDSNKHGLKDLIDN